MQNQNTLFNPYAQNVAIVKSYFKKPLVLTQGILYIVSGIISVLTTLVMIPTMNNYMDKVFSIPEFTMDMSESEAHFMSSFMDIYMNVAMIVAMIPSLIITALAATAFILIYKKSKNPDPSSSPKAGVTILYILSIVQLVPIILMCLWFLLIILIMILGAIAMSAEGGSSGDGAAFAVMTVIFTIIFGGMGTLFLLFFINQVRYYKSILNSLTTVNLSNKGAGIYGVFSIIYGAYLAINTLSSFAIAPMFKAMANNFPELEMMADLFSTMTPAIAVSSVASVLMTGIYIINAIIALGYKKYINNIKNEFNAVEYAPVGAVPAMAVDTAQNAQPSLINEENPQIPFSYDNFENPAAPHCPRCNSVVNENDIFCNKCGTKVK